MITYREISIIIGLLYLFVFIVGILSISQAVDNSRYLTESALNSKQVYQAALFQFILAILYITIAILLYPILKVYNERLALGFLSSRIIAVVFILIGTIILLMILRLSQDYVKDSSSNSIFYNFIGNYLKLARDLVNHIGMVIVLCIGGIMLYILTLQTGLIPTWISIWGICGSFIAILASILVMTKYIQILTPTYLILNLPIAIQEIVFAVWLIFKGFKQV